jgi:secreted trypsin-like serine protease
LGILGFFSFFPDNLGDEGGPLQYQEGDYSRYFIYGVTSYWGEPCGHSPAVYTRVSEYMDFILDNLDSNSTDKSIENNLV